MIRDMCLKGINCQLDLFGNNKTINEKVCVFYKDEKRSLRV